MADEQDLFEEEALAEAEVAAAAAGEEEEPTREVHPESPELVGQEEEPEPEEVEEELEPEPTAPPVAHEPMVPLAALHEARETTRAVIAHSEAIEKQNRQILGWIEAQQATQREAEAAAAIPDWEKDPKGHLLEGTAEAVASRFSAPLEQLAEKVNRLDSVISAAQQQEQQRTNEQGWRQVFTMQEAQATPEQRGAIEYFHRQHTERFKEVGYDETTASQMADEERLKLYMNGAVAGQNHGPVGLVTLYQRMGIDPQSLAQSAAQASAPPQVPAAPRLVPPQQPRQRMEREEPPAPVRTRRPTSASHFDWIAENFYNIVPNELVGHVERAAKEEGVTDSEIFRRLMKKRERISATG